MPRKAVSGAGPMPSTVLLPLAICVLPASATMYVTRPAASACTRVTRQCDAPCKSVLEKLDMSLHMKVHVEEGSLSTVKRQQCSLQAVRTEAHHITA
eukprot:11504-Heterococcus_DN1.PRE.2